MPLAFRPTQTGEWLAKFGAGVLLEEPIEESLAGFFETLNPARYALEKAAVSRIPAAAFVHDDRDCREFFKSLLGLRHHS